MNISYDQIIRIVLERVTSNSTSGMADDNQQHDFEGSKRLLESEHPSLVDRYYQSRYLIGKYFYFHDYTADTHRD